MPFMAEEEGEEEEMGCGGDISDRTKSKRCCNDVGYVCFVLMDCSLRRTATKTLCNLVCKRLFCCILYSSKTIAHV